MNGNLTSFALFITM